MTTRTATPTPIAATEPLLPAPKHTLHYDTPAKRWDEALPLGNGIMGTLLWGDGSPLRISLDRADLWDQRPIEEFESDDYSYARLRQWRAAGDRSAITCLYDDPYFRAAPTKIPAGRIELTLPGAPPLLAADLDLHGATATMQWEGGITLEALLHARKPLGLLRFTTPAAGWRQAMPTLQLLAPDFAPTVSAAADAAGETDLVTAPEELRALGYGAPQCSSGENWQAFSQQGYGDFHFAVHVGWKRSRGQWLAAWSVASSAEAPAWPGQTPAQRARATVQEALEAGFARSLRSHRSWWSAFWARAGVRVPDAVLERQWYLDTYKFGAAARRGAPPVTLQGPWTADDGKLPPWKGDYHNDLNTQLSYWPCYSGNQLEAGLGFLDWLWEVRDTCRAWTKSFFDAPGLNYPGVCTLDGSAMGGWPQYSFSCTTSAWLAQHFYWHWRFSGDRRFLRERAHPFLAEAATFIEAMTGERDAEGARTLALSSSPEINDNRLDAWFDSITNYDLALIRWLLQATAELEDELRLPAAAAGRRALLAALPQLALGDDGRYLVCKDLGLTESHRHFSHLMAIYPLKLINLNDPDPGQRAAAQRTLQASLKELEALGTSLWCGYSFAWQAALYARAGDGEGAQRALQIFAEAFILRNSFHCNGDQTGKGYSSFDYRPFTLEGNFAAAAALQEMLLQSDGGVLRIFPAVPARWREASFTTLRTEGAYLVSAQRQHGATSWLQIRAEKKGVCKLLSPFSGALLQLPLGAGQTITLTADP